MEACGEVCLARFARYRFCEHIAIRCNFCQMVTKKGGCDCYGETSDEDVAEGSSQQNCMYTVLVDDVDDDSRMEGWSVTEHETDKRG